MKRASRLLQIEMRKRDVSGRLSAAIDSGRQPLAFVKRYPAVSMTVTALVVGLLTRLAVATPVPATLKVMSIPVIRRFVGQALVAYQKTHR